MSNEKLGAEQGREPQTFIEWWNSHAGPKNELAKGWAEAAWIAANRTSVNVDSLAAEIRRVDGKHSLGAGALAEALMPFLDHGTEQAYHARGAGRAAALEEVRRMLEDQRKECLNETVSMGLNRIRADELDNALINLRALAAEPGADTGTTPPSDETSITQAHRMALDMIDRLQAELEIYRSAAAERGTTPPDEGLDWWTEAAADVVRHARTDSSPDWRNAIVGGLLRAYNRGQDAAAQRAPVEQGRRLTKQQREELVSAAHTLGDFTIDTDHRAQELILLVESYMAAAPDHAREGALRELRASGWMVAVHNDYRQDGKLKTFWLFVKGGRAIKGEGDTDAEALTQVAALADGKEGGE